MTKILKLRRLFWQIFATGTLFAGLWLAKYTIKKDTKRANISPTGRI
jgi:hypothetical protein